MVATNNHCFDKNSIPNSLRPKREIWRKELVAVSRCKITSFVLVCGLTQSDIGLGRCKHGEITLCITVTKIEIIEFLLSLSLHKKLFPSTESQQRWNYYIDFKGNYTIVRHHCCKLLY
jgi:hypothetical protein